MRRWPSVFIGVSVAFAPACTLMTSVDGLAGGLFDASAPTDASALGESASSDAASDCPCPPGSIAGDNGRVCVVDKTSPNRTCPTPIDAPPCRVAFDVTLCADDPKFPYDPKCSSNARQTAFFALGRLPEGKKWSFAAGGIDVMARTDIDCDGGVPACGVGPNVSAELAPLGTTLAVGKQITSGCKTLRVDLDVRDASVDGG